MNKNLVNILNNIPNSWMCSNCKTNYHIEINGCKKEEACKPAPHLSFPSKIIRKKILKDLIERYK